MTPRIGIYIGTGTSHSWLWFVDLCSRLGYHRVDFLDEQVIQTGRLSDIEVLVITGGDTFAVAEALGQAGASQLSDFVKNGGIYIGSCAGAYLPMRSSKSPLNEFNFVRAKITNLSKHLPEVLRLQHKSFACYGCDFIYHPVREEVELKLEKDNLGTDGSPSRVKAPLYGGPAMIAPEEAKVLATYSGFTSKTLFIVQPDLASTTVLGHAAAIRIPFGRGVFYLFGPHFEHPSFPEANEFLASCIQKDISCPSSAESWGFDTCSNLNQCDFLTGIEFQNLLRDLKREVSNSRLVAAGIEFFPVHWTIGHKVYEPEKIRVFLENIWSKLRYLERCKAFALRNEEPTELIKKGLEITHCIRRLKKELETGIETTPIASDLFSLLQSFSIDIFSIYFKTLYLLKDNDFQNCKYKDIYITS